MYEVSQTSQRQTFEKNPKDFFADLLNEEDNQYKHDQAMASPFFYNLVIVCNFEQELKQPSGFAPHVPPLLHHLGVWILKILIPGPMRCQDILNVMHAS